MNKTDTNEKRVLTQLISDAGEKAGSPFDLPLIVSKADLQSICDSIIPRNEDDKNYDEVPYNFYVNDIELSSSLLECLKKAGIKSLEHCIEIVYQKQAIYRVFPVTRCTSTLQSHEEAIISVQFSPTGRHLVSGSGDFTLRLYDLSTELPYHKLEGHKSWVFCLAWSPNELKLASACKSGVVLIWDPNTGNQLIKPLLGHKQWITCLQWKPMHLDPENRFLASSSKDTTIKIWDTIVGNCVFTLSGHSACVTCIRWAGSGKLYSSSQDRLVNVWHPEKGVLLCSLKGHAHWVNTLALSTDYILRTSFFEPGKVSPQSPKLQTTAEEQSAVAQRRYEEALKCDIGERLVSGSDDFTMFLWDLKRHGEKPIARMTGHQQLINHVQFSPDGRLIASASFDKSVKLWNGFTGKFITSLRGHITRVYQLCWSSDSRLLASGGSDSTVKVWQVSGMSKQPGLLHDLPGHSDEVYAVDWSPDGQRVASGSKDHTVKIWRR